MPQPLLKQVKKLYNVNNQTMKTRNLYLSLLLSLLFTPIFAQFEFGIKGGVNYDSFGDVNPVDVSLANFEADAKTAFHLGVYSKIDLLLFYLRPELQFSQSKSDFGDNSSIALNKIETPILLGYKVLGPLSVFAGPSFQYILSEKANDISLGEVTENFTVGLQLGTRLQLGRLGVGIRFERGFTDNEIAIIENNGTDIQAKVDTRAKQWILSASYELKGKSNSRKD